MSIFTIIFNYNFSGYYVDYAHETYKVKRLGNSCAFKAYSYLLKSGIYVYNIN